MRPDVAHRVCLVFKGSRRSPPTFPEAVGHLALAVFDRVLVAHRRRWGAVAQDLHVLLEGGPFLCAPGSARTPQIVKVDSDDASLGAGLGPTGPELGTPQGQTTGRREQQGVRRLADVFLEVFVEKVYEVRVEVDFPLAVPLRLLEDDATVRQLDRLLHHGELAV